MGELRHFEVVSPTMRTSGHAGHADLPEPPEETVCYVVVEATNKRDAIRDAIRTPEFREWVGEARSDGRSPYVGVKATETVCDHGVCHECTECEWCNDYVPTDPLESWTSMFRHLQARLGYFSIFYLAGMCPGCAGTGRVNRCVPYDDVFPCSSCGGLGTLEAMEAHLAEML